MANLVRETSKILVGISVVVALSACTEKTYGPEPDKAPVDNSMPDLVRPNDVAAQSTLSELGSSKDFDAILDKKSDPSSARVKELYESVLLPLSRQILDEATLSNPVLTASPEFFRYARAMHEAIQQIAAIESGHSGLRDVLKRYEAQILKPCLARTAICNELAIMARDSRYSLVIMTLVKTLKPDKKTAWKYFSYSLDFSEIADAGKFVGIPNSDEYARFALDTVAAYLGELALLPPAEAGQELTEIKKIMNQIVISLQGRGHITREFLSRMDVWGKDAAGSRTKEVLREALWPVLISNYAIINGEATNAFDKYVRAQLAEFDTEVMGPFRNNPHWKKAIAALNIKDLTGLNETLVFIVDQAYRDKMSVADALGLLESIRPSTDEMITIAERYVQIRFAQQVLRTQDELKKHLGDSEKYTTIFHLRQQLAKAKPLEIEWANFQMRASLLKGLIESQAAQESAISDKDRIRLDVIFNKMDRNIKWFAIYPNMLPVIYYISKSNFADKIQILWFTFTLNSDLIMQFLFDGALGGWFNFTNAASDHNYMTSSEVLLAYRNAVLSGVFDSYNIKMSDYLYEVTNRLTAKTSALLERISQTMYDTIVVDYDTDEWRNMFSRAHAFCKGDKSVREEIDLKDLSAYLTPFTRELDGGFYRDGGTQTTGDLYYRRLPSKGPYDDSFYSVADFIRTDDMFYIDMIEKMIQIYSDYRKEMGMEPDADLKPTQEKLNRLHSQIRHTIGMMYQLMRRFDYCQDNQRTLFKNRMVQVMRYEQIYLDHAYAQLDRVAKNPELLSEVNASFRRVYPDVDNVETQDGILHRDGKFAFIYNKGDFMLRLRGYLLKGVTTASGERLPPIAPDMIINFPARLLANTGGNDYRFFYTNFFFVESQHREGMTAADFTKDILSTFFYSDAGDFFEGSSKVRLGTKPMVTWGNLMARSLYWSKPRMILHASLAKLGKFKIYDFDKPGCTYSTSFEQLESECVVETEFGPQDMLAAQKRDITYITLTPEIKELYEKTTTMQIASRFQLRNSFFSQGSSFREIGILDGYRYVLNAESVGSGLVFPGEEVDSKGYVPPRLGYRSRSIEYFRQIAVNGDPLLKPVDALSGGLKEMFQAYVDRDFKPLLDLERFANKEIAAGRGTYELDIMRLSKPYVVPMFTQYSMPAEFVIRDFNQRTDYIFDSPGLSVKAQ